MTSPHFTLARLGFMRTMVPVLTSPRAMKVTASPDRNFALAASRALRASSLSGAQDFGVAPSRLAMAFQAGPCPAFGPASAWAISCSMVSVT